MAAGVALLLVIAGTGGVYRSTLRPSVALAPVEPATPLLAPPAAMPPAAVPPRIPAPAVAPRAPAVAAPTVPVAAPAAPMATPSADAPRVDVGAGRDDWTATWDARALTRQQPSPAGGGASALSSGDWAGSLVALRTPPRVGALTPSLPARRVVAPLATNLVYFAGHFRQAESTWYRTHTMAARGDAVWRCLFAGVRLSAAAIDVLLDQRRACARKLRRLANWPDDETFVATLLVRSGARCTDLNDFGATLHDDSTYTFHRPFDGHHFHDREEPMRIFHPILFGDDLLRKIVRMAWIDQGESLPRKVKRRVINALNTRLAA